MQELDGFWHTVAISLINGGALWVIYLALEPWLRRRWPHTMIGWTRYTAQGIRDPLVGRDLLVGVGFGLLTAGVILSATLFVAFGLQVRDKQK
jgi:serine/threonine-protein kinase